MNAPRNPVRESHVVTATLEDRLTMAIATSEAMLTKFGEDPIPFGERVVSLVESVMNARLQKKRRDFEKAVIAGYETINHVSQNLRTALPFLAELVMAITDFGPFDARASILAVQASRVLQHQTEASLTKQHCDEVAGYFLSCAESMQLTTEEAQKEDPGEFREVSDI